MHLSRPDKHYTPFPHCYILQPDTLQSLVLEVLVGETSPAILNSTFALVDVHDNEVDIEIHDFLERMFRTRNGSTGPEETARQITNTEAGTGKTKEGAVFWNFDLA